MKNVFNKAIVDYKQYLELWCLCEKCPVGAIQMEDRCPVWKSEECELCVLDVFTDVRDLQSAMAMEKRIDMGSIKIRIQEFRRNNSELSSNR